jgi:hypothetical protein
MGLLEVSRLQVEVEPIMFAKRQEALDDVELHGVE